MARNNWSKEETMIALNVYCKIPFKSSSKKNPVIIKYANIINRSPSALNMKIGNIGRLDPELRKKGIVGLANGSKLDEKVWNEANYNWEKFAYESELLIEKFTSNQIDEINESENFREGLERETIIKQRVNQSFFRSTILSAYYSKCCITELSIPELLIASHIVPWSKDEVNRLNPRNGLCLNSIHDKAFDSGFITITTDFRVKISKYIEEIKNEPIIVDFFLKFENKKINLPDKFLPSKEFLDYHYKNIFKQ